MKTRTSTTWTAGLVLILMTALVAASRAQNELKPSSTSKPIAPPALPGPALAPRTAPMEILPPEMLPPAGLRFGLTREQRPPFRNQASYWTGEIVKLAQAGVDDSVILAFLDDVGTFNLGADDIIYLSDLGVSSQVITAMLQHDFEFAAGNRPATAWIMPFSQPTVHLVFTTNSDTATRASNSSAPLPAASANSGSAGAVAKDPMREFSAFDYAMNDASEPARFFAPEEKPKLYAVREPYPVKLTDPIVVFRAAVRMPNVQVLEMFP